MGTARQALCLTNKYGTVQQGFQTGPNPTQALWRHQARPYSQAHVTTAAGHQAYTVSWLSSASAAGITNQAAHLELRVPKGTGHCQYVTHAPVHDPPPSSLHTLNLLQHMVTKAIHSVLRRKDQRLPVPVKAAQQQGSEGQEGWPCS